MERIFQEQSAAGRSVSKVTIKPSDAALAPSNGWADEVLTKPLRTDALATSLARVLDAA